MSAKGKRVERVAELLREEVSRVMVTEIQDPRLRGVTVTAVDVSPDLKHARVYWGFLGSLGDRARAAEGLARSAAFLQGRIGRDLDLRYTPRLQFEFDVSGERGEQIDQLLDRVRADDARRREEGEPRGDAPPAAGGLLLIDKAAGPTSMRVVERVRRALGERRAGHVGTLDPLATGLLPVLFGRATRLLEFVLAGEKEYETEVLLGRTTDTDDVEGATLEECDASGVTRAAVDEAVARFVGEIVQRPPRFSAIKVEGTPLYARARRGEEVEPEARTVSVREIEVLEFAPPRLRLRVRCGAGTYIRSLARDLGEALGVGGTVAALRRTRVGPFSVADAVTVEILEARTAGAGWEALGDVAIAPAAAIPAMPAVALDADALARLRHGAAVADPRSDPGVESPAPSADSLVKCVAGDTLVAVARADRGERGERVLRPLKVFD